MTAVSVDKHFLASVARNEELTVGEASVGEGSVNDDLVVAWLHRAKLCVGEAEAPCLLVKGGPVGDRIRPFWYRVQPATQVVESHAGPYWSAVLHDVQVVAPEVDHALAACVCDVRVANIPFLWNGPVKDPRSRRHLV